jgi:cytochrome c553
MSNHSQRDTMKAAYRHITTAVVVALALAGLAGCADPQKSRNVNDPQLSGKTIAMQVCSNCHGPAGESTSPMFPKLAGQQREYLIAQLADFKGHDRSDSAGVQYMWGFTHLTARQVDELAEHFSSQTPMRASAVNYPDRARGKLVFEQGLADSGVVQCVACHGPSGEGNASFPRLAGQHSAYVLEQIKVFQSSDLRPRGAPMKQITHSLSEADALAVAHYIAGMGRTP